LDEQQRIKLDEQQPIKEGGAEGPEATPPTGESGVPAEGHESVPAAKNGIGAPGTVVTHFASPIEGAAPNTDPETQSVEMSGGAGEHPARQDASISPSIPPLPPSFPNEDAEYGVQKAIGTPPPLPATSIEQAKGGKGGGGGDGVLVTNREFLAAVFAQVPEGASTAVCVKSGDPAEGGWPARGRIVNVDELCTGKRNNYFNCSTFYPGEDGGFKTRKDRFAACHVVLLDDLGTKVLLERLGAFELSWLIETSPGNYQGGIILAVPIASVAAATRLSDAVINAGLCDKGLLARTLAGPACQSASTAKRSIETKTAPRFAVASLNGDRGERTPNSRSSKV
jgi:hypothetical protein